jgi:REP element-mobilizing transposase RayT
MPLKHQSRSIRLNSYDYAVPGAYFVTICTRQRQAFFDVPEIRRAAEECWLRIAKHVDAVELDEWVVMPNHVQGLIIIVKHAEAGGGDGDVKDSMDGHGRGVTRAGTGYYRQLNAPTSVTEGATPFTDATERRDEDNPFSAMSPRRNTLSVIVRTYKAAVTRACRVGMQGDFAWQRGYYEHVVRSRLELAAARRYIRDNPSQWELDRDNPSNMVRLSVPTTVAGYLQDLERYQ